MPDTTETVGHDQTATPAEPRQIHDHKVNPANDKLKIEVLDGPGSGGASHHYRISGYKRDHTEEGNETVLVDEETDIHFQNGPIVEAGANGLTQEALLAICIDRLRSFQKGPYSCRDNACALTKMEEAQMWLQKRTLDRMRRGVEGKHIV